MDDFKLYDAEYKFISIIWEYEPINSTELVQLCLEKLGWKKSTTYTVLKKLCTRGILTNVNTIVTSIVKKDEVQRYESNLIVDKSFDGSLPKFLTAFLNDKKLSPNEAQELIKIIEEGIK